VSEMGFEREDRALGLERRCVYKGDDDEVRPLHESRWRDESGVQEQAWRPFQIVSFHAGRRHSRPRAKQGSCASSDLPN